LTVGAWDIAPAWHEQLNPAGRLLLPLWIRSAQKTVAFERADAHLSSVSISNCGFMRLRGQFAGPEAIVQLGDEGTVRVAVDDRSAVDPDVAHKLLTGSSRDFSTGVQIRPRAIWEGLLFWLALREPNFCSLSAEGEAARRGIVPRLFGTQDKFHDAYGLLEKDALCLLTRPPDEPTSAEPVEDPPPVELIVRSFGEGDALARRLIAQVTAWKDAGCPGGENLRIRAYPRDTGYAPSPNEIVVNKQWMQFVFDGS
jgi:protein-L-isoaspartate(D-aspartate) O-methyltransferase